MNMNMDMTREEMKELAWIDSHDYIRERVIKKLSPAKASLFIHYFTPEKLLDFDN